MSEVSDLLDRIAGSVKAADGMVDKHEAKIAAQVNPAPSTMPEKEEMDAFTKVVEDMKGQVDALYEMIQAEQKRKEDTVKAKVEDIKSQPRPDHPTGQPEVTSAASVASGHGATQSKK